MATPETRQTIEDEETAQPRATRAPAWMMLLVVVALVAAVIAFASWVDTDPEMIGPALGPQDEVEDAGQPSVPATGSATDATSSVPATSGDSSAAGTSATTGP
jgi:hypothetical protein